MSAEAVLSRLSAIRIVPVITIDDADKAADVAAALVAGGIGCGEITLRTPDAMRGIAAIRDVPGFLPGAGTVLTVEQVDRCVDAGAQFLVCPGFDDEVVERARFHGVAILPGVATATEIQRALKAGLTVVKFFPADRLGGLDTIKALAAPLAQVGFVPSGGVSAANMVEYLAHPAIFAVSGSWMAPRDIIAAGGFDAIESLSREASELAGRTA
ncbi:MAG TPA: bifunctional 4-hydroxy-2-oxoglutarate aldolase/2-dehydro-3-deoxy-phosphogluconate aldolase [Galbitalea sp.]|jgi:2-dehydro-3-deoxyphosphogluconate aldolase/(4S)-4-hydroxy-2-oxoglutarate aldolase